MAFLSTDGCNYLALTVKDTLKIVRIMNGDVVFKYINNSVTSEVTKTGIDNASTNFVCHAFSKEVTFFAAATEDKKLIVWKFNLDIPEQCLLLELQKRPTWVTFLRNEEALMIADKYGDVYKCLLKSDSKPILILGHLSMILSVCMGQDSRFIISGDRDEKIRVSYYPNTYSIHSNCLGHKKLVSSLEVLSETLLLSTSADKSLKLWNFVDGAELFSFDLTAVTNEVDFVPSQLAAKETDICLISENSKTINFFQIVHNKEIKHIYSHHLENWQPLCICAIQHGRFVVATTNREKPLILFSKSDNNTYTEEESCFNDNIKDLDFPSQCSYLTNLVKPIRDSIIKKACKRYKICMASIKILACGSVHGNFSKFFKKLSNIQKKNGPFEMVLCCGEFFSDSPECEENWKKIKVKGVKVDIPVYLLGPTSKTQKERYFAKEQTADGEELHENVLYLGKKGIFKTASGLSLAYLSGGENSDKTSDGFTKADISSLREQIQRDDHFVGVDILLTSCWPRGIETLSSTKISKPRDSLLISQLASVLKPRYHFTSHPEKFFEPPPYRNHIVLQQEQQHVTRFIAMAPFLNETNEKGLYAFSITPISKLSREALIKQPDVVAECPYKSVSASQISEDNEQTQQFFFRKEDKKRKHGDNNENRAKKTPKGPPPLSSECWFCLGSKNVEKHLVVSVGEQSYVALAKGALNEDHVLICPVAHHNSTAVLPDEVRMEMEKYKQCLRKMFAEENKMMVSFERNFYTQHLQLQVVGIPDSITAEEVVDVFEEFAQSSSMELTLLPEEKDLTEFVAITTPYFYVEIGSSHKVLHKVKGKMPLQFGREVLASGVLLNLAGRVDWKSCKLPKDAEIQQTKMFRKRFQPFDFNFT